MFFSFMSDLVMQLRYGSRANVLRSRLRVAMVIKTELCAYSESANL